MRRTILACLLALVAPALSAAPQQVAAVLRDLRDHGYTSPMAAVARLQAATDANDTNAPVDLRRRYDAALIALSLPDKNMRLLRHALQQLQQIQQHRRCQPCSAQWLVGKAEESVLDDHLQQARANLELATRRIDAGDPEMQLQLSLAQIRLESREHALNVAFGQTLAALDLAERLHDTATHIELTITLAMLDARLGYLDQAVQTVQDAITQAQAVRFTAALALARLDQSYIYASLGRQAEQFSAAQEAMSLVHHVPGLAYLEVSTHANLSEYYLEHGNFAATLQQAHEAADLAHSIDDVSGEAVALANSGVASAKSGRVDDGVAALRQALALAHQSGNLWIDAAISEELGNVLEAAGRYKEALQVLKSANHANREITEQKRDRAVHEMQARYNDERKNRQIEQLSSQAAIRQAEEAAHRWQQRLWGMLAAVALAGALLLLIRLIRARRANRQLAQDIANLAEQSALDALTGVFNRRHFATLMQPYERSTASVGLVMVDIDHFKRVNDELGHEAGDAVLREVARRLQSLGRAHDCVVRWGGEEFVLVLPDAAVQGLPLMARRLLDAVAAQPVTVGKRQLHVTVSAGCVVHPLEPASSWEHAMRMADQAMYRAKRHGRNRATCLHMSDKPLDANPAHTHAEDIVQQSTIDLVEVAGPELPAAELAA